MPYCLSINTHEGIVLCAATYESSSFDTMKTSARMKHYSWPNNRFIALLCSGNILTIKAVLTKVQKDIDELASINLRTTSNLDETADYIAAISVERQKELRRKNKKSLNFSANFIVAGQIHNQPMETLLIYSQGNYIHESNTSPFLQIGENKFGKPILDRIAKRQTNLNTAAHCALVSVDSTIRSNPSKKLQIELLVYKNNSFEASENLKLDENNPFLIEMSQSWNNGITTILESLPPFYWE
jgi:putative proteasome-type protease